MSAAQILRGVTATPEDGKIRIVMVNGAKMEIVHAAPAVAAALVAEVARALGEMATGRSAK